MDSSVSCLYSPLEADSIRLLHFCPDSTSCHAGDLEVVKLDSPPRYYAVSHCWGAPAEDGLLKIGNHKMAVSRELASGIMRLKRLIADYKIDAPAEYIWVDKICINQGDLRERESQVQLMARVFSQSIRTLIWLGSDLEHCSVAWPFVDDIYAVFQRENPLATSLVDISLRLYSDENHKASGLPPWDDDIWLQLKTLLELPWFTRIWVVQEVALSPLDPLLIHGNHLYSWERLTWAASWLRRSGYIRLAQIPQTVRNIDLMANIRRSKALWPLDALLADTSAKFRASDQRDKIYGLLGLAAESRNPSHMPQVLRPDYKISVEQLYENVARFLLWQSKSLAILTRTSGWPNTWLRMQREHDLKALPSWVPDWSDFAVDSQEHIPSLSWISYSDTTKPVLLHFPAHYYASEELPARIVEDSQASVIRLNGIQAAEVVKAVCFGNRHLSSDGVSQEFLSWIGQVWDAAIPLTSDIEIGTWVKHFIQATTAEQHGLGGCDFAQIMRDGAAFLQDFISRDKARRAALLSHAGGDKIEAILNSLSTGGDASVYAALVKHFCLHRSFLVTSRKTMGIGPEDTAQGDLVIILYGGGVPYIARKHKFGWLFVGESYVRGLMRGEAVQARSRGELPEEVFEFWSVVVFFNSLL